MSKMLLEIVLICNWRFGDVFNFNIGSTLLSNVCYDNHDTDLLDNYIITSGIIDDVNEENKMYVLQKISTLITKRVYFGTNCFFL